MTQDNCFRDLWSDSPLGRVVVAYAQVLHLADEAHRAGPDVAAVVPVLAVATDLDNRAAFVVLSAARRLNLPYFEVYDRYRARIKQEEEGVEQDLAAEALRVLWYREFVETRDIAHDELIFELLGTDGSHSSCIDEARRTLGSDL